MDEPVARQLARTCPQAVAAAVRDAARSRSPGRIDDAAAGAARPGVHGQRGADVRQPVLQLALPPRGARPRDAALRRLVRDARLHGRAPAAGNVLRGGRRRPVLRPHAVRRLSHSQRRARPPVACHGASAPGAAAGAGQSVVLPPRHLLLPAGAGRGVLVSRRFRRLWPQGDRGAHPEPARGQPRRGAPFRLQRRGRGQDRRDERRLPGFDGGPAPARLYAASRSSWTSS